LTDDANLQAEVPRQSLEPLARQGGQVVVTKLVNLWREFASWSLQAACRSRRDRYTLPSTRQPSQFGCQRQFLALLVLPPTNTTYRMLPFAHRRYPYPQQPGR
jgi:hypothetical protein